MIDISTHTVVLEQSAIVSVTDICYCDKDPLSFFWRDAMIKLQLFLRPTLFFTLFFNTFNGSNC